MIEKWGDAKKFIFEDIIIYWVLAFIALSWDLLINFSYAIHIYSNPHEAIHPYQFGVGQTLLFILAVIQLARNIERWKYYA